MAQSCAPVFPSQEAKGSITPLQHGSQWRVRRPSSTEEDEMTHGAVSFTSITASLQRYVRRGRRARRQGPRSIYAYLSQGLFRTGGKKEEALQYGFTTAVSGVALREKLGSVKSLTGLDKGQQRRRIVVSQAFKEKSKNVLPPAHRGLHHTKVSTKAPDALVNLLELYFTLTWEFHFQLFELQTKAPWPRDSEILQTLNTAGELPPTAAGCCKLPALNGCCCVLF